MTNETKRSIILKALEPLEVQAYAMECDLRNIELAIKELEAELDRLGAPA